MLVLYSWNRGVMEPDDLLCSCNARPQKMGQGHEELSLLPERAPSEGPRSTAAVKSSSRPCFAEH
jgi:hypothetical protein